MTTTTVDVRCPVNPRRLFMRLKRDPAVRIDRGSNLIEVACRDCAKARGMDLVLHRYDILGCLIETVTIRDQEAGDGPAPENGGNRGASRPVQVRHHQGGPR
jgi:hypothetical protein